MKPKILFFTLLASLVLVVGGSATLFWFTKQKLHATVQKIAETEAELEASDIELRVLNKTGSDIQAFKDDGLNLDSQLPSSKSQSDALDQVVAIFNRNKIPITSVTFLPTEGLPSETSQTELNPISSIYNIPIEVSTSGDPVPYAEFRNFLNDLEHSERHLNVRSLTISAAEGGHVNYSVGLAAHFLLQNAGQEEGQLSKDELLKKLEELKAEE